MKKLISIIVILFSFGCGKSLKEEDVVGSYVWDILEFVLLENGKFEDWTDGEKDGEATWVIVGKEVHFVEEGKSAFAFSDMNFSAAKIEVHKIESNGDLTLIAAITDGKRTDFAKEDQITWKKSKK